jgi:hypothetical protein
MRRHAHRQTRPHDRRRYWAMNPFRQDGRNLRLIFVLTSVALLSIVSHPTVHAQSIQVRVLNARNGDRVPNQRVSVLIKGERDAREYTTDSKGDFSIQVDPSASIWAATEWWVTCRHVTPGVVPYTPVSKIINKGFTEENTCGRAREETIKGEYIIFARRATFFEQFSR